MPPLKLHNPHPWDLSPKEAIQLQARLRARVKIRPLSENLSLVGGVDVGFPRSRAIARAGVAVLAYPSLTVVEEAVADVPLAFPYIPGLLSFREIPAIVTALQSLKQLPDVLLVDGHGYAHPRRFGLACHLGVLLDLPTVGCAKSILVGVSEPLAEERGSWAALSDNGERIGTALRTRSQVKPVYVSCGHRVDLDSSVRLILACGRGYRLPEPIRRAHQLASRPQTCA